MRNWSLLAALPPLLACSERGRSEPAPIAGEDEVALTAPARAREAAREPDVIFVPTPQARVDRMLELADLQPSDRLFDLGCGDGRIAITAARRYGVRAVCIDIDPARVAEARAASLAAGVNHLVDVREADLFETDLADADVITLYLLPELNLALRPRLQALRPGTRVLSHSFDMGDWTPDHAEEVDGDTVYLWVID